MKELGKNLVYALCVIATLLIVLGIKRKFASENQPSLLSQSTVAPDHVAPSNSKSAPQPRVLQAKSVTLHDDTIVSPTSPRYTESEIETSPVAGSRVYPVPASNPNVVSPVPTPVVPELVPVSDLSASAATTDAGGEEIQTEGGVETSAAPEEIRPLPEFVLTEANDSFWSISEEVYGSGAYYRALFRHNESKVLRPDQLRPGMRVNTPPLEVLRKNYPADVPVESPTGD
ncbi:MAG: hypothetical protein H6822_17065 [Planctomycetaceae bacterium]|nr:hypothetical protein [Planctomycetales bacterium]MCB9923896.1 hypothetical protein [Planctomycetaceae bacterium]